MQEARSRSGEGAAYLKEVVRLVAEEKFGMNQNFGGLSYESSASPHCVKRNAQ